jgi:hypothetical protein
VVFGVACGGSGQGGADAPDVAAPRIVAMLRTDVDEAALVAVFEDYLTAEDYIFPLVPAPINIGCGLVGQRMVGLPLVSNTQMMIDSVPDTVATLVYDPECFDPVDDDPCDGSACTDMSCCTGERLTQYCEIVDSTRTAYEIVHLPANDRRLMLNPIVSIIDDQILGPTTPELPRYFDLVTLQVPHCRADYASTIGAVAAAVRAVNPAAVVLAQLIPRACGSALRTTNDAVGRTETIAAWTSVKDIVDGAWVFYFGASLDESQVPTDTPTFLRPLLDAIRAP